MQAEDEALSQLEAIGWHISRAEAPSALLPDSLRSRYPVLPTDAERFLGSLLRCASPSEQEWFLCIEDFGRSSQDAFRWNELELMSLDGASDVERRRIVAFWDEHLPFMLAAHSDYAYLALSLNRESFGTVVFGIAPEFEATTVMAPSFGAFLQQFALALAGGTSYPLSVFARGSGA